MFEAYSGGYNEQGPKLRNDDDMDNDQVDKSDSVLNLDNKYMNMPGADDEEDDDF